MIIWIVLSFNSGRSHSNWGTVRKALTEVNVYKLQLLLLLFFLYLFINKYQSKSFLNCVYSTMYSWLLLCDSLMQQMCSPPWGRYLQGSDHQLSINCSWRKVIICKHYQTETHTLALKTACQWRLHIDGFVWPKVKNYKSYSWIQRIC